jgi:hypothetical protein
MSDLDQLRDLGAHVRPPSFDTLVDTARRRSRQTAAAVAVAFTTLVLITGGGLIVAGDDNRSAPAPAAPSPTQSDTAFGVWGPEKVPVFRVGQTHEPASTINTTIHAVADPFQSDEPAPDETRWVGLDIETCQTMGAPGLFGATGAGAADWELIDADGHRLRSRYTEADVLPQQPYPRVGESVEVGECVRGWALWAVPISYTPATALKVYHSGRKGDRRSPQVAWSLEETP